MNSLESSAGLVAGFGTARPFVTLRTVLLPPRPLMALVSLIYLLLLFWLPISWCASCALWQRGLVAALVLSLIALDRLDYIWFGVAAPPARLGIALLALRFVLFEIIIQVADISVPTFVGVDGISLTRISFPLPISAMLPYFAALYFGAKGAALCGAVVWLEMAARMVVQAPSPTPLELQLMLSVTTYYLILVAFVAVTSTIVLDAQAGRVRAERLLAELERYGQQREIYAAHALLLTADLNQLARTIHEDLNRCLDAVGGILAKMPGFRQDNGLQAEQAVRKSKEAATAALQDVRRSVRMLRTTPVLPPVPAAKESPQADPRRRGWQYWLAPRPFDALIVAVYLSQIFLYLGALALAGQFWTWSSLGISVAALTLLALDRLDVWLFGGVPPAKIAIALLALRLLCIPLITVSTGYLSWANFFVLLIPYRGFVYFGSKVGFALAALAAVGISAMMVLEGPEWPAPVAWFMLYMLAVSIYSHVALSEWSGRERAWKLLRETWVELEQVRVSAAAALTAVQERNHLAREIHDGLGHYLTVINVQLEKALAYREVDPLVADQAAREARRMTGAALEEVRVSLGALDNSEVGLAFTALVNRLVANLASTHLEVTARIEGSEEGFAKQALIVLYRAIQEGLTNVQKHSRARRAQLELVFGVEEACMKLADDGRGFDPAKVHPPDQEGGYGLQGLGERLELVGGRLEIDSESGSGTTLTVTVPRHPMGRDR